MQDTIKQIIERLRGELELIEIEESKKPTMISDILALIDAYEKESIDKDIWKADAFSAHKKVETLQSAVDELLGAVSAQQNTELIKTYGNSPNNKGER